MTGLSNLVRRHAGLINYTILNYLDKGLNFAIPLMVLYAFHDKSLYNEVEYVYSIAAIVSIIIELGVRNYFLYAYRESEDRDTLVERVRGCFLLQSTLYLGLGVVLCGIAYAVGADITFTYLYILARTLYMYFLSFFAIYYRLVDKPSRVFAFSFVANIVTLALLLWVKVGDVPLDLSYLFISQILLVVVSALYFLRFHHLASLKSLTTYVGASLKFAWPIVLNIFLFMFISNFGKIYARNYLSEDAMFHISFVQRAAIIIQLAHASAVGYLSKRIFVDKSEAISKKVTVLYSGMLAVAVAMVIGFLATLNVLGVRMSVTVDIITFLIIGYTVAWCYAAYFELYVNRINKNKYILIFSLISSGIFVGVLLLNVGTPLYTISLGMLVSMVLNLTLIVGFLVMRARRQDVAKASVIACSDNAV